LSELARFLQDGFGATRLFHAIITDGNPEQGCEFEAQHVDVRVKFQSMELNRFGVVLNANEVRRDNHKYQ
jgi:hypothetical protein